VSLYQHSLVFSSSRSASCGTSSRSAEWNAACASAGICSPGFVTAVRGVENVRVSPVLGSVLVEGLR